VRILTVRQPWAWAIVHGGKDVENRVRNLAGKYRGPLAIHVGLSDDESAADHEHPMHGLINGPCPGARRSEHNVYTCEWCSVTATKRWTDQGHIIGVVNLWAVHRDAGGGNCCPHYPVGGPGGSLWSQRDVWHLCLSNPRPLAEPIPYRGALGLRTLPAEVVEQINRQLAPA
jgi:hypothetical protein